MEQDKDNGVKQIKLKNRLAKNHWVIQLEMQLAMITMFLNKIKEEE